MLPIVDINGHEYKLGCQQRVCDPGDLFPLFGGESFEPIPESGWQECDWSHVVPEVMDQDGVGACNAFAATSGLRCQRILSGQPDVRLSPGHLYGLINGGRDAGSLLGDALTTLVDIGVCTTAEVAELAWRRRDWPSGLETVARKYRILEAFDCPTRAHIATAIMRGFMVDYGILVGSDFNTASDGWVNEGKGRGGHAMCGVGLKKRVKNGKTQWGVLTLNSWGTRWGKPAGKLSGGFGIVPMSYFTDSIFTDGWCVRTAIDPSDEPWGPK
jgi:hypothetical protein